MTQNLQQFCSLRMKISILILSTVFLFAQVGTSFSAPPPRGGHGGAPSRGGGPGHGGGGHGGSPGHGGGHGGGPSAGAVIGTALGAIAIGAVVGAALNPPPPAPVPVPIPVVPPPRLAAPPIPHGQVFSVLPAGYTPLLVAGTLFYYYGGSYYRLTPSGYVVVNPPSGAVISTLPAGYSTVVHNGGTCFTYGGAYYRQVANNGYEVITDLTTCNVAQPLAVAGKIMVISRTLNVRSGPGKNNSVVCTVFSGNTLQIVGNAPGWYYVRLPDGTSGWVMAKFTAPLAQPADG